MSSPYCRKSSGSFGNGAWKRKSSNGSDTNSNSSGLKKKASSLTPPPNQRAITSYFTPSAPVTPFTVKSRSAISPTSLKTSLQEESTAQDHKPDFLESGNTTLSIESTQVIDLEDDSTNWETDSQKTEVLAQLEPLMSNYIVASQNDPAPMSSLYYLDEIDEVLQYYDVDLAAERVKYQKIPNTENASKSDSNISYYLSNFMAILAVVQEKDSHLFNEEEMRVMDVLRTQSSLSEQRLFSRLLYRKGPWFQCSKLEYKDISDLQGAISRLLASGIFEEPNSLLDILPALSNVQLRQLTRSSSSAKREQLLANASKWVSTQRTVDGKIIKTPKEVGQCIRIKEFVNTLFKRVHRLFFLNQAEDQTTLILIHTGQIKFPTYLVPEARISRRLMEKDRWVKDSDLSYELSVSFKEEGPTPPSSPTASQTELQDFLFCKSDLKTNVHLSNLKSLPEELENVGILRSVGYYSVFKTREELDEYEYALDMSHQLAELLGSEFDTDNDTTENEKRKKQQPNGKKLNDEVVIASALSIVDNAVLRYKLKKTQENNEGKWEMMTSEELGSHLFLKRFTSTWVYTSLIWVGVSLLERQKRYKDAIGWLKMLLNDFEVNRGRRGEWWIRLVFDVAHLKQIDHAIDLCCEAIKDENCRPQHLLKLYDKLRILLKTKEREEVKMEKERAKNERQAAKEAKMQSKSKKAAPPPPDDSESEIVPSTPKRASRRIERTESEEEIVILSPHSKKIAKSSESSSPASTPSPKARSPRGKRSKAAVAQKIPLPGEDDDLFEIPSPPAISSTPKKPTSSKKAPEPIDDESIPGVGRRGRRRHGEMISPESTPFKTPNCSVASESSVNNASSQNLRTPSLRHTSPVRYFDESPSISPTTRAQYIPLPSSSTTFGEPVLDREDERTEPEGSPLKKVKLEETDEIDGDPFVLNNIPDKVRVKKEEETEIEEEGDALETFADLTPSIAARMQTLGVPLPEKLNQGTIETIYGTKSPKGAIPAPYRSPPPSRASSAIPADIHRAFSGTATLNNFGKEISPVAAHDVTLLAAPNFGTKSVFIDASGNPCSVEEYSLQHYKANDGWPCGTHCEGSPYFALFVLLFWDIIFDATVPYVFQTPYQDSPLDLTTTVFYMSRKQAIDERLKEIFFSAQEETSFMVKKLKDSYYQWHGRSARGMDWGRWKIRDLVDIGRCLGGPVVALFCERFATDFRFTHSGLPDLLLWNPETCKAKLVEVKGPNDKLSEKQKIWIDALATRGCDIATLYVKKLDPPEPPLG